MSTFVCSLAQNVMNILIGIVALLYLVSAFKFQADNQYLIGTQVIVIIVGLYFYFRADKLVALIKKMPWGRKWTNHLPEDRHSFKLLLSVLSLSFLRYIVYLTQFILALKYFGLDTSLVNFMSAIGSIFLIQSSIPVPPILDLFARGEIAIVVLTMLKFDIARILMSTGLLWVINLILPALLGLILLFKVNVIKSLGYETD